MSKEIKLIDLGEAKYIALETFRKNGEGVITPVWVAAGDDKLYVWTGGDSWKVKRIRNNKRVRLCKSDSRGNPQSDWIDAQAQILDQPEDHKAPFKWMNVKYGLLFRLFRLMPRRHKSVFIEIISM